MKKTRLLSDFHIQSNARTHKFVITIILNCYGGQEADISELLSEHSVVGVYLKKDSEKCT